MNTSNRTRAHLRFTTLANINEFVAALNSDGSVSHFTIEDFKGVHRVNARSVQGVIYAVIDFGEETYLVNETEDGVFPSSIDKFRA